MLFAGTCKHGKTKLLPYKVIGVAGAVLMTVMIVNLTGVLNSKWFFGTLAYEDGFTLGAKVFTYLISFAWLVIIVLLTPAKRIPLVDKIGQNTLGIYLFHTAVISVLKIIPSAKAALDGSMVVVVIGAIIVTAVLALLPFTWILRKISIPYKC